MGQIFENYSLSNRLKLYANMINFCYLSVHGWTNKDNWRMYTGYCHHTGNQKTVLAHHNMTFNTL